jgi:hypothetical protein
MRKLNTPGLILVALGLFLFVNPFGLATVMVDTAAPTASGSNPANGQFVLTLSSVSITLADSVSGVSTCSFWNSQTGITTGLVRQSGTAASGVWGGTISQPTAGWTKNTAINFKFTYTDTVGNQGTTTGTFIVSQLSGHWTITDGTTAYNSDSNWNNIVFNTGALTVKFTETAGDATTCTGTYTQTSGGSQSGSITMTKSGDVWTGTVNFANGVYSLNLSASDGVNSPITASIINIGGNSENPSMFTTAQLLGICSMVLGTGLIVAPKKKWKK